MKFQKLKFNMTNKFELSFEFLNGLLSGLFVMLVLYGVKLYIVNIPEFFIGWLTCLSYLFANNSLK